MVLSNALIPIRDDNPTRRRSVVTIALIVLNVLFFVLEPGFGQGESCRLSVFLFKWGVVPSEVLSGHALAGHLGVCPNSPFLPKLVLLSLVTSMFIHAGWLHLGGNMLFLWIFGNNVEDVLGRVQFLLFYLITGIAAALAHVVFNAQSVVPTVGASGAISGVLGAYIILFPKARVTTAIPIFFFIQFMRIPAAAFLGIWFVYQFLFQSGSSAGGGVAWIAHVGGFLAGMLLVLLMGGRQKLRNRPSLLE